MLGSTCCHHSCRDTLTLEGWKDLAGNVRFAKLSAGQGLWAGMWRHREGMEITTPGLLSRLQQNPWQASPSLSCSITRQVVIFG